MDCQLICCWPPNHSKQPPKSGEAVIASKTKQFVQHHLLMTAWWWVGVMRTWDRGQWALKEQVNVANTWSQEWSGRDIQPQNSCFTLHWWAGGQYVTMDWSPWLLEILLFIGCFEGLTNNTKLKWRLFPKLITVAKTEKLLSPCAWWINLKVFIDKYPFTWHT